MQSFFIGKVANLDVAGYVVHLLVCDFFFFSRFAEKTTWLLMFTYLPSTGEASLTNSTSAKPYLNSGLTEVVEYGRSALSSVKTQREYCQVINTDRAFGQFYNTLLRRLELGVYIIGNCL